MYESSKKLFLFWPLVFLTIFLLVFQIMHWQVLASLVPSHELPQIPLPIIKDFIWYIFGQLLLWAIVVGIIWGVTRLVAGFFKFNNNLIFYLGMTNWFLTVLLIFSANQYYFPRSIFSELTGALIHPILNKVLIFLCLILLGSQLLIALTHLFLSLSKKLKFLIAIILCSSFIYFLLDGQSSKINAPINNTQPNIIIIGFDSLRPDQLQYYGNHENLAPNIDRFLKDSTHFSQAISPLARTFSAWTSILTGQYPKTNGARDNLINPKKLKLENTLPKKLQAAGYETVYITDEKRFSNIDETFHFDRVLGPKIGFNDFFLGILYDFPLSNLVVNSRLGAFLFPYHYANRAAHLTYQPDTFNALIKNFLQEKHKKSLFLSIHFCITHWPYAPVSKKDFPATTIESSVEYYKESIRVVDQQFETLLTELKKNGLMNNSFVILLSDHGEAFAHTEDNLIPIPDVNKQTFKRNVASLAGHGADVLSLSQSRVLLSFKNFGASKNVPRNLKFTVSLVDLKPTILDFLNLPLGKNDGVSLKPYIFDQTPSSIKARPIFSETGFMPNTSIMSHAALPALVRVGVEEYELNPNTGRVQIKENKLPNIIAHKQRAVIYKDWLLAFYPEEKNSTPVLVNLKTKEWTHVLTSPLAKQSPLPELLTEMKRFYGDELL